MRVREEKKSQVEDTPSGPTPRRGTVGQLDSGGWRVRFRTPDGKRRSMTFRTAEEAELFRVGCEQLYGGVPTLTLGGYGEGWLDRRELSREHRAIDTERSLWRTHVAGTTLAEMPLRVVTRRHVKDWVDALKAKKARAAFRREDPTEGPRYTERPLSRSVVRQALVLVRQALQGAVEDELITANPAKDVQVGRVATPDDTWTFLTAAEVDQVVTCSALPDDARAAFTVAIYTGLRQGELWGLRWEDVTLEGERPELVVRRSFKGPTKSGKVRRVPLMVPARVVLAMMARRLGDRAKGAALVFPNARGEMRGKSDDAGWGDRVIALKERRPGGPTARPGWKTAAGIVRRVRFHDLRHTCASHLLMGTWGRTWALSEVRDFLGHSSVVVTQKYAHLHPEHLHRAAAATTKGTAEPQTKKAPEGPSEGAECSGLGHGLGHTIQTTFTKPLVSLARPRGLEPLTPRSVVSPDSGASRGDSGRWDPRVSREAARALLGAVATGDPVSGELITALVEAVLGAPLVALALRAREPGPDQLMVALRLAAAVCEASRAWEAMDGGEVGT